MPPCLTARVRGAVYPARAFRLEQVPPDEVAGRQVLVAGHGYEGRDRLGTPVALAEVVQPPRHVLDEARLAGAGGALQENGHALGVGRFKDRDLVGDSQIERLFFDEILFDAVLLVELVSHELHCLLIGFSLAIAPEREP